MEPTALVIGASSGIGLEIAKLLSRKGYRIGLAARRRELLDAYAATDPRVACVETMDIAASDSVEKFNELVRKLGTVDFVYLSSGVGYLNEALAWDLEGKTINTNVTGFARLCGEAIRLFESQRWGHLVGLSSIAALRGSAEAPAYGASKAFISRYLQALRFRVKKSRLPIYVTDVRPGFVDTAMMKADSPFWVATPQKAAQQIVAAAERRRGVVYVTRRWSLIAALLKFLPD
ncbi:SDR family NAD(P)-dependent oxidoreductase [soil metagenome]